MRRTFVAVFALLFAACGSDNGKKPGNCEMNPNDPSCTKSECNDGINNDGDGLIDYPKDPACYSPNQQFPEDDDCPGGPNCPECANTKDDDGNGYTDYTGGDPGCM